MSTRQSHEFQMKSRMMRNSMHGSACEAKPMHQSRHKLFICNSFTLVELLVVIAVIAILAAMLLPTLNQAKEKAKTINCVSNFKQLGLALNSYISDNKEWFPEKGNKTGSVLPWGQNLLVTGYITTGKLLMCPSATKTVYYDYIRSKTTGSAPVSPTAAFQSTTYGLNYCLTSQGAEVLGTGATKLSKMKNHSQIICLADSQSANNPEDGAFWLYVVKTTSASFGVLDAVRHGGVVNVLWVDGHVTGQRVGNRLVPYESEPFRQGNVPNDPANYFDLK